MLRNFTAQFHQAQNLLFLKSGQTEYTSIKMGLKFNLLVLLFLTKYFSNIEKISSISEIFFSIHMP